MFLDFTDGFGDLVHVRARAEQLVLGEPDGLLAEAVVLGAVEVVEPLFHA